MIILSLFMYLGGFCIFIKEKKVILIILLRLEFIIISLLFIIFIKLGVTYLLIIFLSFRVCESSLGLSILVMFIRSHGNDFFKRFNILW